MNIIKENNLIKIYNDGIEILSGENLEEIKEIINIMIENSNDKWELEVLNKILYNINIDNLFHKEVA
ncbi:MAG: hypothetical protein ACRC57_00570 [Sarcina sp.]